MMYYVLVLLFAAHIALFWYGHERGDVKPLLFAMVLALFTTFAPLYPGIEVPKPDSSGVMAIQDPVTAAASFVLLTIYSATAIRMSASSLSAIFPKSARKVKPRWP